jgi:hypothetical protein
MKYTIASILIAVGGVAVVPMTFTQYVLLAIVGFGASAYKMLGEKMNLIKPRRIVRELLLSVIISIIAIPAAMEQWNFSFTLAMLFTAITCIFSNEILRKIGNKIEKTEI